MSLKETVTHSSTSQTGWAGSRGDHSLSKKSDAVSPPCLLALQAIHQGEVEDWGIHLFSALGGALDDSKAGGRCHGFEHAGSREVGYRRAGELRAPTFVDWKKV
jgi:hypothetical protein